MKKKLDVTTITNELEGGSAFFPSYKKPVAESESVSSEKASTPPLSKPKARAKAKKKTQAIKTPGDDNIFLDETKKLNEESPKTLIDVMTSLLQDVNPRKWRDTIENTETRGSSLRLTNDEIYAVQDILKDLERQLKIKTSINELARLGLLFLIHDFKRNGEKSLIYKVKKS
jgi:hypothetical protein